MTYLIIFALLLIAELIYFKIADKCNIIDKPNERSSHSSVVLRGGGIIFLIGVWIWSAFFGFQYPWFLAAVTLAAGISFVDDIRSLPDSVRLVVQFTAMGLMFLQLDILHLEMWWIVLIALIVCVGASNIINFMDGINGITAGYSLAVLAPLLIMNHKVGFMDESFLTVVILSVLVFSIFNFRERGKAKCFAGDVGSVGIAFIMLFLSVFGGIFISATSPVGFTDALYEAVSALATVGLTAGVTGSLSVPAQYLIILYMYFGRVGVLTISLGFLVGNRAEERFQYAQTNLLIG